MNYIHCLIFCLLTCSLSAQSVVDTLQTKVLQPADMQADFRYFRRLLEETHPGLYRYTPKPVMQAKLDSIDRNLDRPLPFYTFFRTIAALVADVRCAHTHALPAKNWRNSFNNSWKMVPFYMFPSGNRSYVLLNGTTDQTIKPGFELLTINGQPLEEIRQQLYRYYWTDGYIESARAATLKGELLDLFYYWFIDRPNEYVFTFRTPTGDTIRFTAPGQPFSTTLKTMMKNPVNKQMVAWHVNKKQKHPWRLSFPDTLAQTAFLRIDGFGARGINNGEQAIRRFEEFMDGAMAKMTKKRTQNLIVDLRGNPGGWDSQGIELFTYLMKSDTAVAYYARQHSVTDSSEFIAFSDLSEADRKNVKNELIPEEDGTFTLKQGSNTRTPKRYSPKPNRFRGQVYILMDAQSASTTSEFLAVAHANKIGVFVGVESGGAYEGGNGSSFITLELPKSGIQVSTPLVYYDNAVPKPAQKGRGTLPDYIVSITMDDILYHTDSQLNAVVKLIRARKN
ncbi:S41 family peptidase [Spirosoma harenae]